MLRREFITATMAAGLGATAGDALPQVRTDPVGDRGSRPSPPFKLQYAPHFGMFRRSAGEDLAGQLQFMADEGFTALEDNGMRRRPREVQETVAGETTDGS